MAKKDSCKLLLIRAALAILLLIIVGTTSSCSKEGVCISSTGEIITETRLLPSFNQVELDDNINLIIDTKTVGSIVKVEAGGNLTKGIITEVTDGLLVIKNKNKCNWMRSYDVPINVYLADNHVDKITYNSSGNISMNTHQDILQQESLKIEVWGGCGTIDLSLNIQQGNFSLNMGTADLIITGSCYNANVYSSAYGQYDGRNLMTANTFITNKGSNNCYVKAKFILDATIESIGNIYYVNQPDSIHTYINGPGQVMPY